MATAAAAGSNPPSKMETMSRDELLLHAKKQLVLLHRTKAKCDEIGSKNGALEASLAAKHAQLADTRAANDELESKLSSAVADNGNSSRKIQDLREQLDCMKMKDETAGTTFLCLREEISSLQSQIEDFKKQVSQLRDDNEVSLKSLKDDLEEEHSAELARTNSSLSDRIRELVNECTVLKEERVLQLPDRDVDEWQVKYGLSETKLREMTVDIENLTQEKQNLLAVLNELTERCDTLDREKDVALGHIEDMRTEWESMKSKQELSTKSLIQENDRMTHSLSEASIIKDTEIQSLKDIIDELKSEGETLKCEHADTMASLELSQKESETLKSQIRSSEVNSQSTDLQMETLNGVKDNDELLKSSTGDEDGGLRTRLANMEDGVHRLTRTLATLFDDDRLTTVDDCITLCSGLNKATIHENLLTVTELESQNGKLQQVVTDIQTALSNLEAKVDNLEAGAASDASSVACQTPKMSTSETSVQCGDVVDLVDVATSTETGNQIKDLIGGLLSNLDGLLNVVAELEHESPSDDKRQHLANDLRKWMEARSDAPKEGEDDVVECMQKIGEVLDALPVKLKNYRDSMKIEKPDSKKGVAESELLNKYKAVALKAKKESTATTKKLNAAQQELQAVAQLKSSLEDKIRIVTAQLAEEKQKHRLTASSLEQHSSLISLEMADYERHANDLTEQLTGKDALIGTLEKDIERQLSNMEGLHHQIEQLEKQNRQSEERIDQLKTATIKLRSELLDFQKSESDWNVREGALVARFEAACQEVEAYKLQVADASANLRELESSNRSMRDAHRKAVNVLEARVAALTEETEALQTEYGACRTEYEGYKIRVHSVLKQQKTKSTSGLAVEATGNGSEQKELLEKFIQSLRARNQELTAQHEALLAENEALQEEHGNVLNRHNKLVANLGDQESSWRQRLETLQSELRSEQQEQVELGRQLRLQQEAHRVATERQADAHGREVEQLRERIDALDLKLLKQKIDADQANAATVRASSVREDEPPPQSSSYVPSTERQEGEGSEFNESSFSSSQKLRLSSPTSSFVPLERLLNRDEGNDGGSSAVSVAGIEKLENRLSIASKKIDHMAEILHESETNNARATEQVRLLKDEIRRLERNQEREKHMANMEYLKNVIVKFLALSSGDERERLVPVLTTLLRLSPEEEQRVLTVARGSSEATGIGSGWSTYLPLPRWPGT